MRPHYRHGKILSATTEKFKKYLDLFILNTVYLIFQIRNLAISLSEKLCDPVSPTVIIYFYQKKNQQQLEVCQDYCVGCLIPHLLFKLLFFPELFTKQINSHASLSSTHWNKTDFYNLCNLKLCVQKTARIRKGVVLLITSGYTSDLCNLLNL